MQIKKYKVLSIEEMMWNMNKSPRERIEDLVFKEGKIETAKRLYVEEQMKNREGIIRL